MTLQSDEGRQSRTEDARKRRQFFAMVPMRAADNLMKALQLDEAKYRGVAGHAQQDARAYFLYGAIDEVFKVCTATLRWAEFIDAPEEDAKALENSANEAARHMHRVVIESVLDEQHMWSRKLTELLIDLILFQTTNQQDCYRLYLACAFLDAYLRLQQDFAEFFACRSGNADATIEGVLSEARALLAR